MKQLSFVVMIALSHCFGVATADWNDDDTSGEGTLQIIQIVHTHGDRTPSHFVNDDPFIDQTRYWPEGVGQLTKKGRQQMFQIGRYLHEHYQDFLQKHLQKEIIEKVIEAHSSGTRRCLESTTLLVQALVGVPPQDDILLEMIDDNNVTTAPLNNYDRLTKYWRPIPVKSRHPKGSNHVLDSSIQCPNLREEIRDLKMFNPVLRKLWRDNAEFIDDLSHYCGERLDDFDDLYELLHELTFERDRNLSWSTFKIWTRDFEQKVIDRLFNVTQHYLQIIYGHRKVQTLSVGPLLGVLALNMKHFLESKDGPRVFVYGTHDSKIVTLLDALDLFPSQDTERTIDGGSAISIELRQLQDQYFVRTFYVDDPFGANGSGKIALFAADNTNSLESTFQRNFTSTERFSESFCFPELPINPRHLRCPIANFLEHIKPLEPFDWQYQCGIRTRIVNIFAANFAILSANLGCVIVLIFALKIYSSRIRLQT